MKGLMVFVWICLVVLGGLGGVAEIYGQEMTPKGLGERYIMEWRKFYPSQALAAGDKSAAALLENLSPQRVEAWVKFNQNILGQLQGLGPEEKLPLDDRIDVRLLKRQARCELDAWVKDRLHLNGPAYYGELISQALTHLLARQPLPPEEMRKAVLSRLQGILLLSKTARANLKNGSPERTRQALEVLEASTIFYQKQLPRIARIQKWVGDAEMQSFQRVCNDVAAELLGLTGFVSTQIVPRMDLPDAMGVSLYGEKLQHYTDSDLTPVRVEQLALAEIGVVREKIVRLASQYWREKQPGKTLPTDSNLVVQSVLERMESHCVSDQQGFLQQFKELIDRVEAFVLKCGLVTLPGPRTLFIDLSPAHFAGAAVGGVYPAGPFAPDGDTLFYLPAVSDSAVAEVRERFYRSFNTHFNTVIIAHEIVPGHYLQLKVAAHINRPVRAIFGGDLFAEGWATWCEQVMLEQGWGEGDVLTELAHLRKRLENAVRAYVSVQVHCAGWNREKLLRFAWEEGWLAPQFASNLWERVNESPLQLLSYFLGYREFERVYREERERLGKGFSLRAFADTLLGVGAMPLDLLPLLFSK